jgi:UDP-N-acetylmuramoyl-tripeptide--D-alanyl-D-alanine ligase
LVDGHSGSENPVRFTAGQIVEITGGDLLRGDLSAAVDGISTDTRTIRPGEVFVALKGPNFDGHAFIPKAEERGARGTILQKGERPFPKLSDSGHGFFAVAVEDSLSALGDLAAVHRERCSAKVIAVTGSVGKTTTKEMIAGVLKGTRRVCATEGNQNNLIGVPKTLFRLSAGDEILVVELGTDRPGEIGRLSEIVRPDIAVITEITECHLAGFGDLVSVAEEKAEILRHLGPEGRAFLREGVVFESLLRARTQAPVATFGFSSGADIRAVDVRLDANGRARFRAVTERGETAIRLQACGRHQVWNALAAVGVCEFLEIPKAEIAEGLADFREQWGRMQSWRTKEGARVIHDGYNANPASVRAAVETLGSLSATRRFLVLGEMLDLGRHSERLHRRTGREISRWPIDDLVVCGEHWEAYVEGAIEGGISPERIHPFASHDEVIEYIRQELREGDVVLVKGSRATRMETICDALPAEKTARTAGGAMVKPISPSPAGGRATASGPEHSRGSLQI